MHVVRKDILRVTAPTGIKLEPDRTRSTRAEALDKDEDEAAVEDVDTDLLIDEVEEDNLELKTSCTR